MAQGFVFIVVDVLNDFFAQHASLASQRRRLVDSLNRLTKEFRRYNHPILWVRQEFASDLSDAFLDMKRRNISVTIGGTEGSQFLEELVRFSHEKTIVKKRYSAFFHTELDQILETISPKILVVAGINTHACIRTTVIDAYQRDYNVIVAADCVASHDADHGEITMRYLAQGIARIASNEEIIEMLAT